MWHQNAAYLKWGLGRALPPKQVPRDAVSAIVHIALIVDVQGEVAIEVQVALVNKLGSGLSNDDREDVPAVAHCVQISPAGACSISQACTSEAAGNARLRDAGTRLSSHS